MDVEFKLFGELTIRQFGYVAGGALVAFVCYVSFADIPLIRWPLVVFFGILGIMLAVFKVNDRPFEVWLANFIFALFTSQRRIWKKSAKTPEILRSMSVNSVSKGNSNVSINRAPLSSVYVPTEEVEENISKEDKEEMDRLNELDKLWGGSTNKVENTKTNIQEVVQNVPIAVPTVTTKDEVIQTFSKPAISIPKDLEVKKTEDVKEVKQIARIDLDDILPTKVSREDLLGKMDEKSGVDEPIIPDETQLVSNKVASVVEDKLEVKEDKNEKYVDTLKSQLEEQNKIINSLREKSLESKVITEPKKIVLEEKKLEINEKKTEPINDEKPIEKVNYVSGTVKDKSGKGLSNVTLIIKDSKFRPVRATRTNNLGAFNITTSLPNGDYSLEAVRSGMNFESIDFNLDGTDSKEFELVSI